MKIYFTRLFKYDQFANRQIATLILNNSQNQTAVQLMAHLLAAQQIWLKRCKTQPAPGGPLWPDWPAESLMEIIDANHQEWLTYLETLQPDDFETVINYQNTAGLTFNDKLSDILAHVINHGTHHRAQAGQHLKMANEKLPVSDYILYIRQSTPKL
jgi:uncharacterized damage-inducible protein DinB